MPAKPEPIALRHLVVRRLHHHRLVLPMRTPEAVVSWYGAVQAQDFRGGLWALGLRMTGGTELTVESALAERRIVRTWPFRRTLHLVAAADVRWMLAFVTPRLVRRFAVQLERNYGLDRAVLARCRAVLERVLRDGQLLSRPELYRQLESAGIATGGQRGMHILCHLSMEGLLCGGPRLGAQPGFALLEAWLPKFPLPTREEALAGLARRYFTAHGPATLADFTWWSSLPAGEAREALALGALELSQLSVQGETYWVGPAPRGRTRETRAVLLPPFDEYLVGYRDRKAVLDPRHASRLHALLSPVMLWEGRVVGTWLHDRRGVRLQPFERPGARAREGFEEEAVRVMTFRDAPRPGPSGPYPPARWG